MKTVFLAFANSKDYPLQTLTEEDNYLRKLFYERNRGLYLFNREPHATLESVNEALGIFSGSVLLFHYSGHADRDFLLLENQVANGAGIARQLQKSAERGVL